MPLGSRGNMLQWNSLLEKGWERRRMGRMNQGWTNHTSVRNSSSLAAGSRAACSISRVSQAGPGEPSIWGGDQPLRALAGADREEGRFRPKG